jgi:hypothetical protein
MRRDRFVGALLAAADAPEASFRLGKREQAPALQGALRSGLASPTRRDTAFSLIADR